MGLSLNWPGELSQWLSLSQAMIESAPDDADAKAATAEAASMLNGVEIRVKTIERRRYLELLAESDKAREGDRFERLIAAESIDYEIAREGLAAIRGLDGGDPPEIDDRILKALAATKLIPIISSTVIKYNSLTPDEKRGFFISAAAD